MHHYQHHIGDYRRDTGHLSLLEHGCYRQLMDMYYLSEKKIPKETEVVFRRLSAKTEEERVALASVLNEFFILTEEGYKHTRCEVEIESYKTKADTARTNGKLGGRPNKTKVVISRNLSITQSKANHKPITNNHSSDFDEFWSSYPKKKSRGSAEKVWSKINPDLSLKTKILEALAAASKSMDWIKDRGQYIPHPASWLNAKGWEDEFTPAKQPALALAL